MAQHEFDLIDTNVDFFEIKIEHRMLQSRKPLPFISDRDQVFLCWVFMSGSRFSSFHPKNQYFPLASIYLSILENQINGWWEPFITDSLWNCVFWRSCCRLYQALNGSQILTQLILSKTQKMPKLWTWRHKNLTDANMQPVRTNK